LSLVLQKRPLERGMYYIHGFDWRISKTSTKLIIKSLIPQGLKSISHLSQVILTYEDPIMTLKCGTGNTRTVL